jgi:hypothetical protein
MRPKDPDGNQQIQFDLGRDAMVRFAGLGKVEMSGFITERISSIDWVPSPWNKGPESQLYMGDDRRFEYPIPLDKVRFYASFDFTSGRGTILVHHTCVVTGDCWPAWPAVLRNGVGDVTAGDDSARTHSDFTYSCCPDGKMDFSWSVIHGDRRLFQSYIPGLRPAFRGAIWLGSSSDGSPTFKYEGQCFPSIEVYEHGNGTAVFQRLNDAPSSAATWIPGAIRRCDEHGGTLGPGVVEAGS